MSKEIFPFHVGQTVVCIRGEAGLSIEPYAERLHTGETYTIASVTPNYSKVRRLSDNTMIGGSFGNWRFEAVEEPTPEVEHDAVEHPNHYTSRVPGIECIQVVQHFNFNRGNAIKYVWRAGLKGDEIEDLRKAKQYIDFEIERIQKNHE